MNIALLSIHVLNSVLGFAAVGPRGTLQVLLPLDLLATATGAISGALVAVRKRLDIVGVFFLAVPSGLGGGMIRDVLLGRLPPLALSSIFYLPTVFISAAVVIILAALIKRIERPLVMVDMLSLGLFACVGAQRALAIDLQWPAALLIGTLNAVGGGIIRDLLLGQVPRVLLPGMVRTSVVIVGCCLYIILVTVLRQDIYMAWFISVSITYLLLMLSTWMKWYSPESSNLDAVEFLKQHRVVPLRRHRRPRKTTKNRSTNQPPPKHEAEQ